ncbi:TIGR04076 family protein [Candidatus Eisenbacteria bacterium]|uniref:TIGR04076 family protein n=1 Tax=Eiseniibacteriota bacterium TaxID=2212470 RepID=A0ABV6YKD7_UNCEI
MYKLKVTVEEVKGKCTAPHRPGDYFEVKDGNIRVPDGKFVCLYSLQSLIPLLPANERELEEQDWMYGARHVICPDPEGGVLWRIDRIEE